MWDTSEGIRRLYGAESELVRQTIDVLIDEQLLSFDDHWEEDDSWNYESGIALFDSFSAHQRIGLLHEVAEHLLSDSVPPPRSATADATIAAIFLEIRDQIHMEIDFNMLDVDDCVPGEMGPGVDSPTYWRQLVLAAYEQASQSDLCSYDAEAPLPNCRQLEIWELLVSVLTDRVIGDRDYELAGAFLDVDPEVSEPRKRILGITNDYFTSLAPDPTPLQIPEMISKTRQLVRSKPR